LAQRKADNETSEGAYTTYVTERAKQFNTAISQKDKFKINAGFLLVGQEPHSNTREHTSSM